MNLLEKIHERYVFTSRVANLAHEISSILPVNSRVLDVGCGSGLITAKIAAQRPDLYFEGIDVLVREKIHMPVKEFDGKAIPFPDNSFNIIMFVDVLHHVDKPIALLEEARRVASNAIVIKDHNLNGFMAYPTLKIMDWLGNARYGVALPYNYLSRKEWVSIFETLELLPTYYNGKMKLYPPLLNLIFGRSLHFSTYLKVPDSP